MRTVSLNVRLAEDAPANDHVEAVLMILRHPRLAQPQRLSTDNTERLSIWPLRYGTRSTWQTPGGEPFQFIGASVTIPDEGDDAPPNASITVEDVDDAIAKVLMANPERATVDLAVVIAAEPNVPIVQWLGLEIAPSDIAGGLVTIALIGSPILEEYFPKGRMLTICPGFRR